VTFTFSAFHPKANKCFPIAIGRSGRSSDLSHLIAFPSRLVGTVAWRTRFIWDLQLRG